MIRWMFWPLSGAFAGAVILVGLLLTGNFAIGEGAGEVPPYLGVTDFAICTDDLSTEGSDQGRLEGFVEQALEVGRRSDAWVGSYLAEAIIAVEPGCPLEPVRQDEPYFVTGGPQSEYSLFVYVLSERQAERLGVEFGDIIIWPMEEERFPDGVHDGGFVTYGIFAYPFPEESQLSDMAGHIGAAYGRPPDAHLECEPVVHGTVASDIESIEQEPCELPDLDAGPPPLDPEAPSR